MVRFLFAGQASTQLAALQKENEQLVKDAQEHTACIKKLQSENEGITKEMEQDALTLTGGPSCVAW